ncbi:MAG: hypothetical protein M0Q38_16120 [Bacteroidales bacterium]|jgi:hypothetical protein|nr:hypothetical protein [Bacteroidales bacterium]
MIGNFHGKNAPIIRTILIMGAFLLFISSARSQYFFNDRCREAYRNIFSLQFREAEKILEIEKKQEPANLIPVSLENYIDFLTLYIGEEKSVFNKLISNKSKRIRQLEKGQKDSPYYNYCLAEIYLQWAFVRLKFGDYTLAALDIRKAYKLFSENDSRFPGFLPNKSGLGIIHIMIGFIPDNYKWIKDILGMDGSIDQGMDEFRQVVAYSGPDKSIILLKIEASFYLAMMSANLQRNKLDAKTMLNELEKQASEEQLQLSPLIIYVASNILIKNGSNDEALEILQSRSSCENNYPFYYLDYLEGLARLNRLDLSAEGFIRRFVGNFRGQNYIRSAIQKLAWIALLNGDTIGFHNRMNQVKNNGASLVDEDKQALYEAISGAVPSVILLRSRLLFDGGYYNLALKELMDNSIKSYIHTRRDFIEYTYRMGRIYHEMGVHTKAIEYYKQTIQRGKFEPYYFSCAAALQLGLIYENKGLYSQADSAFHVCLSIDTPQYKTSLGQKAKAGLNRLKSKKSES